MLGTVNSFLLSYVYPFFRVYLCLHLFTYDYYCLPMFTFIYSCLTVYHCKHATVFAFLLVLSKITYVTLYYSCFLSLLVFNCLLVHVYLCLPMFTRVYLCLHLFTCLPLFTRVYLCLPVFTCLPLLTRIYLFITVNSCLPFCTRF